MRAKLTRPTTTPTVLPTKPGELSKPTTKLAVLSTKLIESVKPTFKPAVLPAKPVTLTLPSDIQTVSTFIETYSGTGFASDTRAASCLVKPIQVADLELAECIQACGDSA